MKLIVVVDNIAQDPALLAEHGLAIWIDTGRHRLLLDAGKADALFANLRALHLDSTQLDALVLSHGHHDHSGNFAALLEGNPSLHLHVTHEAWTPKWSQDGPQQWRYAGIPADLRTNNASQIHREDTPHEVLPGVWSTGVLWPRGHAPGVVLDARLHRVKSCANTSCAQEFPGVSAIEKDPFCDEQALLLQGNQGDAVVVGCCHRGIPALLQSVQERFPQRKIHTLIGGFHMAGPAKVLWEEAAQAIEAAGIQRVISLHCSGKDWMDFAAVRLPLISVRGEAGMCVEL